MITADQLLKPALDYLYLRDELLLDATEEMTARELGVDSLDVVEMVLSVEEALGIEIKDTLDMKPDDTLRQWAENAAKELNK